MPGLEAMETGAKTFFFLSDWGADSDWDFWLTSSLYIAVLV